MFKSLVFLAALVASSAYARETIWKCQIQDIGAITVTSKVSVKADRFGVFNLTSEDELEVKVEGHVAYQAKILFQNKGVVTKHGVMASYLLETNAPDFNVLKLELLGIDEFDRQTCDIVIE